MIHQVLKQPKKAEDSVRSSLASLKRSSHLYSKKTITGWKSFYIFLFVTGFVIALGTAYKLNLYQKIFGQQQACVMYGVQDSGGSSSQFFTLNTDLGTAVAIGPEYSSYDIEGFDIHPQSGELFGVAGGGGSHDGEVYLINKTTGALTLLGNSGAAGSNEIVSASFRPDGTFWAFQSNVGIVTINLTNGTKTLQSSQNDDWEGLAWNLDGTMLYGSAGSKLYQWNPQTNQKTLLCSNLPSPTEALDFRPDGTLIAGKDGGDNMLNVYEINPQNCTFKTSGYPIPYHDVESIAYDACGVQSSPALTLVKKVTDADESLVDANTTTPGQSQTYTLTVTNSGTGTATQVTLTDDYDQTNFTPTALNGGTDTAGVISWNLGDIAAGATVTKTVVGTVKATIATALTIPNSATADGTNTSPVSDSAQTSVTIPTSPANPPPSNPGSPSLNISKVVSDSNENNVETNTSSAGEPMTYTITVRNTGTADADSVVLTDDYDQASISISNAQGGTDNGSTIVWNLGKLQPGGAVTKSITVMVKSSVVGPKTIINTASAVGTNTGTIADTAQTQIPSSNPPPNNPGAPSLAVTKLVSDSDETRRESNTIFPAGVITYMITLQNTGTADAFAVTLTDNYDEAYFIVSNPDNGANNGSAIVWNLGTVSPGQTITKTVTGIVKSSVTPPVVFDNIAKGIASNAQESIDSTKTTVTSDGVPTHISGLQSDKITTAPPAELPQTGVSGNRFVVSVVVGICLLAFGFALMQQSKNSLNSRVVIDWLDHIKD